MRAGFAPHDGFFQICDVGRTLTQVLSGREGWTKRIVFLALSACTVWPYGGVVFSAIIAQTASESSTV